MLWLCIHLPQLPLEALRCDADDQAIMVSSCEGNTRWIVCSNAAAEQAGIKAGINYTVALAIQPGITVLERRCTAERAALERLAAWAYQFSSRVILSDISEEWHTARHAAVWLEIGASLKLFGGFRKLIEQLESERAWNVPSQDTSLFGCNCPDLQRWGQFCDHPIIIRSFRPMAVKCGRQEAVK